MSTPGWMLLDEHGNAMGWFESRVEANVALRNNDDCVLMEYYADGMPVQCILPADLPASSFEITYSSVQVWT